MKRISAIAVGFLLGGVVWNSAANANLVVNGDFENDLNSWTAVQRVVTETSQRYIDLAGATGDTGTGRFASFGSANDSALGSLSQTIATVAGESYVLTFGYGGFSYITTSSRDQSLRVTIGATTRDITTQELNRDLAKVLQPFSFQFSASGSSTLIAFSDVSKETLAIDGLLDNVRVEAVPLPGALPLVGAGLFVWLALGRRRAANR
jgi:hypothetical protein